MRLLTLPCKEPVNGSFCQSFSGRTTFPLQPYSMSAETIHDVTNVLFIALQFLACLGKGNYFPQYLSTNSCLMFTSSGLKCLRNSDHATSSISVVSMFTSIASSLSE